MSLKRYEVKVCVVLDAYNDVTAREAVEVVLEDFPGEVTVESVVSAASDEERQSNG